MLLVTRTANTSSWSRGAFRWPERPGAFAQFTFVMNCPRYRPHEKSNVLICLLAVDYRAAPQIYAVRGPLSSPDFMNGVPDNARGKTEIIPTWPVLLFREV